MLIQYIDCKTGQSLSIRDEPLIKTVPNSYLEYWLQHHNLKSEFYIGKFYPGTVEADRLRLESANKVLIFTNGADGYFTDAETARLIREGDKERGIAPIYAAGPASPHNLVAYGSLIASDGMAATNISSSSRPVKILVIDDERRELGDSPILDSNQQPLSAKAVNALLDKMGDGTMLVAEQVFQQLVTSKELERVTDSIYERFGISDDLATLPDELAILAEAQREIDKQITKLTNQTVSQFRAATPDAPGMIKGTMASSAWCDRLGVDAIISSNCIKGDDGQLSSPGIKTLREFWLNRKSDGAFGKQVVGPQVKMFIPEATRLEFNPRQAEQAQTLAELAANPSLLKDHVINRAENSPNSDYLIEILKADKNGLLNRFSKVNYGLQEKLRGEWVDNAIGGIYVPSAMAQHHAALMPWEVCNRDLPHGAIVTYYRSPFPNVGAAAIAINNTEILKSADPEAFRKNGVAYLNPWTAKNIAITDFDKDCNGYFVGYLPTTRHFPDQIRMALLDLPPAPDQQYEGARAYFEQMIRDGDPRLKPGTYPLAVKEFIERNAPDHRPPEVVKMPKVKHPWQTSATHSQALWQAWAITADNPTGMVANTAMILQSLALECLYCPSEQREALAQVIGAHYQALLEKAKQGKVIIPTHTDLQVQGFSALNLLERITTIRDNAAHLASLPQGSQRQALISQQLMAVSQLLTDIVNGPVAANLQTAVDTAKSSRGIDQTLQKFAQALAHKEHLLRKHQKDSDIYVSTKILPTNTQEPIGWAVEQVNQLFQEVKLPELKNETYRDLFPRCFTPEQETNALAIAKSYNKIVLEARSAQSRLSRRDPADFQPTVTLKSTRTDKEITLCRFQPLALDLCSQVPLEVTIHRNLTGEFWLNFAHTQLVIGQLDPEEATEHRLDLTYHQPITCTAILTATPSFNAAKEPEHLLRVASHTLRESITQIPEDERIAYAAALWRHSEGMGIVLRCFTAEIQQQLQQVPALTVTGLQHETNQAGDITHGFYQVKFSENSYANKQGIIRYFPSIAITTENNTLEYGAIDARSLRLPYGSVCTAEITPSDNGKVASLQLLEVLEVGTDHFPSEAHELWAMATSSTAISQETVPKTDPSQPVKTIGRPVQMVFPLRLHDQINPLPVDTCIEAMRGYGRCHTTRTFSPYDAYQFAEGDIALAYAGQTQVAFRVGPQYSITSEMRDDPTYRLIWSALEKHAPQELLNFKDKPIWGLHMTPLGDYREAVILPFPDREIYTPTRGELRNWFTAARLVNNLPLANHLKMLGQQLNALHQGTDFPPLDFKHSAVAITLQERERLDRASQKLPSIDHHPKTSLIGR